MDFSTAIVQGFLLGLSSGLSCLASCAPVLLPVMAGNADKAKSQARILGEYMAGRLAGYLLFASLGWWGQALVRGVVPPVLLHGGVDLGLACLLFVYLFLQTRAARGTPSTPASWFSRGRCLVSPWSLRWRLQTRPWLVPLAIGFVSGLALCPPFLVALAKAGIDDRLSGALLFFLSFFCATSVFFLPLPFAGKALKRPGGGWVARFACALVGLYLGYAGVCELFTAYSLS